MTDAETKQRARDEKPSFRWMVEVIGVLSGVAFVGTGVLNAIYFHLYMSLDYFSIATPSDVIMASIKTMAFFAAVFVGLTALIAAVILSLVAVIGIVTALAMIVTRRISGGFKTIRTSRVNITRKALILYIAFAALISLPYSVGISSNYVGVNMKGRSAASLMSRLPKKCQGGEILWIGERNTVVGCPHGIAVFPREDVVVVATDMLSVERTSTAEELGKSGA